VTRTARLNDGRDMPLLGFGTWQISNEDAGALVQTAIDAGHRLIDTASIYRNEEGVGVGIRAAGEGVWLTTKLWNDDQGAGQARVAAGKEPGAVGRRLCRSLSHPLAASDGGPLCRDMARSH
jgi:2,5-diketo-D-gluconate reductase A